VAGLKGAREAKARARAIQAAPQKVRKDWQKRAVQITKAATPSVTGKTRRSIKARHGGGDTAQVVGNAPVLFIDRGVKAHDIEPVRRRALKFKGREAIFRPKAHKPRQAAKPYLKKAARLAMEAVDPEDAVIRLWNGAA
jgi:hypothetical protein